MDKENNNKLKKYKKKLTTKGRVDLSKGGRVKAAVGGIQKAPINRRRPPMSIQREEEPMVSTPSTTKQQPTFTQAPIESKRPDVVQPQETFIENLDTAANNIDTTFRQAPTTGKGSDQMFIGRTDQETREVQPTSKRDGIAGLFETNQTKDEAKGTAQAQAQTTAVNVEDTGGPMSRQDFFTQYGNYEGVTRGSQGAKARNEFNAARQQAYEDYLKSFVGTGTGTGTETSEVPITGTTEQFEAERAERITQTGRTAKDIAAGKIPEGILPEQELVPVKEGEEYNVETIELAKRKGVNPKYVEEVGPEVVQQMEDISTVKTPEPILPSTIAADTVTETVQVNTAKGEIRDEALAKAVGVERIDPVEAVEVEIEPGALANRVVGTLSEEAKSTAAQVAGTSLPRITRAKKQLRNAGLSEEDIAELGSDPEALEDRLADFSEEQRGIIEGLPEEALVSTQINGLLEGIENGEIPTWARPAVAQVEQMLARRGMSASTVGRDSLFNAIIQSAMPIAQSNAQAIQQSVSQQKTIEAQTAEANAQRMQQTALTNAQNVFNMDMAQFNADQQTSLSNSKFMQTVGITNANNAQQATIQNAVLMSQANLAEADFYQKAQINNANAFLNMDLTNLNNAQQVNVLKAQQEQQRLLSNQAANNAAAQFNATSENQTRQFMTSISAQIEQFNAAQLNSSQQFNVAQQNARTALEFQVEADLEKANAAMVNQINQFNEQTAFERDKFNTANAQQIEQSNLAWRRQANTINTAAANQVAMQNAQNAFNMTSQAQSFLWQELRDQADFAFRASEGEENRKAQLYATALANESDSAKNWDSTLKSVGTLINALKG